MSTKRARRFRRFLILFLFSFIALALFLQLKPSSFESPENSLSASGRNPFPSPAFSSAPSDALDLSQLYSPHAILMDAFTGEIMASYQADDTIYPASLTKIMTALIALEHIDDLNQTISISGWLFDDLYAQDASLAGFEPDEEASFRDLLYGVLLPSGAECCAALTQAIAGSEPAFVDLMNARAQELGMDGTHFSNATGLHAADHYSTVKDIAILLRYALQNETFRAIFCTQQYFVAPSAVHPDGFSLRSTLTTTMEAADLTAEELLGGKTGYTDEAGLCLASLGLVSGHEYIVVTAGAPGSHDTAPYHILDALWIYRQLKA